MLKTQSAMNADRTGVARVADDRDQLAYTCALGLRGQFGQERAAEPLA